MKYLEKITLELGNITCTIVRDEDTKEKNISIDNDAFEGVSEIKAYLQAVLRITGKKEIINKTLYHVTLAKNDENVFKFILDEEQLQVFTHTLTKSLSNGPLIGSYV